MDRLHQVVMLGWIGACVPGKSNTETASASESSGSSTTHIEDGVTSGASTQDAVTSGPESTCGGRLFVSTQLHVDPEVPSGFVRCDDGPVHRREKLDCRAPATPTDCPNDALGECRVNADCDAETFGSCRLIQTCGDGETSGEPMCECVYGCRNDADCDAGEICRCAAEGIGPVTRCIPADCTQDADCPGESCALSFSEFGDALTYLVCTTPGDACEKSADCDLGFCAFSGDRWDCNSGQC